MAPMSRRSFASVLAGLLTVVWYGAALFLALTVCMAIVLPWIGGVGGHGTGGRLSVPVFFSVDTPLHAITGGSQAIGRTQIRNVTGSLSLPVQSRAFLAINLGLLAALMAVVLWIVGELRALIRAVRDGRPFVPANATHVRRIGWAMILGAVGQTLVVFLETSYVARRYIADGLQFNAGVDLHIGTIMAGLIVLVIGEAFRAGTRLQEEQSLTV